MGAKTLSVACLAFYIEVIAGYYCDNDKCSDDEYCCGYNLCCKSYKVWDMWYFWCGLLFFMFLLSMCACVWKLRSRSALLTGGYPYTPLGQEASYVQTCTPTAPSMMTGGSHAFADLHGNPPPYSHPDPSQHKSSSPPPAYAQVVAHRDIYDD